MEISDLDRKFRDAEDAAKADFARMRTSLLLVKGDHYNKKSVRQWERIRTSRDLSQETKLRLTKNHIGKICRRYSNIILGAAPGVHVKARHERELQDIKAAELNQAVWESIKESTDWQNQLMEWIDDFVNIGEVWTKLIWNPNSGGIVDYEYAIDPMSGEPVKGNAIKAGKLEFEQVFGFNVLGDPTAKNIKASDYHCVKKMRPVGLLKKMFPQYADKFQEGANEEFQVFDGNEYRTNKKGEMLVKEWFMRPKWDMPSGYFCIQVQDIKCDEGDLPGGIYPLIGERFEYIQTQPRGIAATEPLRPYQAEVNRTASKIAEHQITLGDDKLILLNGSKLSAGVTLPGIRGITVSGQAPTILEGRSGAQYGEYMLQQIKEMYQVAEIDETPTDVSNLQPHTLLYQAASRKLKFSRYISRFETYLKEVCKTSLAMSKLYMSDQDVIMAVGRSEQINIPEFKSTKDQSLQITIEEQAEDMETKLGKAIQMDHLIQYIGPNLDSSTLGKILTQVPYLNLKDSFSDLTTDYEGATNDILALDRGELPQANYYDKHPYYIQRLNARKKQGDFKFLHPHIQMNYDNLINQHMQFEQQQKEELVRANSGFIPDGGALVGVDYFVQDPKNPDRTRRARVPYQAIDWLVKKLQDQGAFQQQISNLPTEEIAHAVGQSAEIIPPQQQTPMS